MCVPVLKCCHLLWSLMWYHHYAFAARGWEHFPSESGPAAREGLGETTWKTTPHVRQACNQHNSSRRKAKTHLQLCVHLDGPKKQPTAASNGRKPLNNGNFSTDRTTHMASVIITANSGQKKVRGGFDGGRTASDGPDFNGRHTNSNGPKLMDRMAPPCGHL